MGSVDVVLAWQLPRASMIRAYGLGIALNRPRNPHVHVCLARTPIPPRRVLVAGSPLRVSRSIFANAKVPPNERI